MNNENTFYFLRHAETKKDPNTHAKEWVLTEDGSSDAHRLADSGVFDDVDMIFSSSEEKAYLTAMPIARRLGIEITRNQAFDEVRRGEAFLSDEEFKNLKREKLENLDCKKDGGESGREAIKRFSDAIDELDKHNKDKKILVVSHGTILTLYFASLGADDNIFQRWKDLKFCSWGITKNQNIKRGIVK